MGGGGVDPFGHDMIARKLEGNASGGGVRRDAARRFELVVLDERASDGDASRLEEGVRHGAADEEPIDLAEEVLDDLELVGHLGAAENRDKRSFGRLERVARDSVVPAP